MKTALLGRLCRLTDDSRDVYLIQGVFHDPAVDRIAFVLERADAFGHANGGRLTIVWEHAIILQPLPK